MRSWTAPRQVTCLSSDALVVNVLIPGSLKGDPIDFRISQINMVLGADTEQSFIKLTLTGHEVTTCVRVIVFLTSEKLNLREMRDLLKLTLKSS